MRAVDALPVRSEPTSCSRYRIKFGMMTIGALSRHTGVNVETIRYYERIKLMPPPPRTKSGRRLFGPADTLRLTFIRHARELGFDLSTIRTMLTFQEVPESSCEEISTIAANQLRVVEGRINRLLDLKSELSRMIEGCANGKVADCRIVAVLSDTGNIPQ